MILSTEKLQAALLSIPLELSRISHELKAGLQEFHNGTKLSAARFVDVSRRLGSNGSGRLLGWSLSNPSGGDVLVRFRNGRDGDLLAVVKLLAGGMSTHTLPASGVSFPEALWFDVTSGTAGAAEQLEGAAYIGAHD